VNGTRTDLPAGRLTFDTDLPDTSDVNIRLDATEPLTLFEYMIMPANETMSIPGFIRTKYARTKLFRRSKASLHEFMSSRTEVTLGQRSFSMETLLRYPNITTLNIEVREQRDFNWQKFQLAVRSMTWLKELSLSFKYFPAEPYVFELFEGLPPKLTITGGVTVVAVDRLTTVRDLTADMRCNYYRNLNTIGPHFAPYLQSVESLEFIYGTLQLDVRSLASLKNLRLDRVNFTYRDCVAIGRLLRRNQLESLEIRNCEWLKKNELRPIVQPLLEGTNTSLHRLGLFGIHMSKHMIYMLQDVVSFCPTLTSFALESDSSSHLLQFVQDRSDLFEDVRNIRIAKNHVPDVCPLKRAMELTESVFVNNPGISMPTFKRRNRRWHRTRTRQIVCAPFEFLLEENH
jgi:hypothetical protein